MSKLKDLIYSEARKCFEHDSLTTTGKLGKRQISVRSDAVTLLKIDTLSDILDMSRQGLIDDLLEQGIDDAIDAFCEAHGPDHKQEAYEGFLTSFKRRWAMINEESDQ